ncbi:MAG: hypothetical protein AB7P99_06930 [Vicinamibacterales bacterium]
MERFACDDQARAEIAASRHHAGSTVADFLAAEQEVLSAFLAAGRRADAADDVERLKRMLFGDGAP